MNQMDHLERDLTTWLDETAVPRRPDYADEILRQTARLRQRPRWTFLGRWLPTTMTTLERVPVKPLPWRAIGLLAILGLLLAAMVVVYVGSRPRLPAPFGPAANGLAAYASNGDIFTVDPATGIRRAIVIGRETDHHPRWSLDGTRLAFLRQAGVGDAVVVADAAGEILSTSGGDPLVNLDTDSVAWSPDGRTIVVVADLDGSRGVYLVNALDGDVTRLAVGYAGLEVYWRPPDGRQVMFLGGAGRNLGLYLYSMDEGSAREVPISIEDRSSLRPGGWTPDGRRFLVHLTSDPLDRNRTLLLDVATGAETFINGGFGHVSNDGLRVVGFDGTGARQWLCVAHIEGGPCVRIGQDLEPPEPSTYAGLQWSPDDHWIVTHPVVGDSAVLLDPDGGGGRILPSWPADGLDSWQRRAP